MRVESEFESILDGQSILSVAVSLAYGRSIKSRLIVTIGRLIHRKICYSKNDMVTSYS